MIAHLVLRHGQAEVHLVGENHCESTSTSFPSASIAARLARSLLWAWVSASFLAFLVHAGHMVLGVFGVGGPFLPLRWPLLFKHPGVGGLGGGRFRVTMDTSFPAVHRRAPPTLRHQRPSSSIVDEFKCG